MGKWMIYSGILFLVYMMFMHFYITSDYIPGASRGGIVPIPNFKDTILGGRYVNYILGWFYYLLSKLNISHYQNMFVIQIIGILLYAWAGTIMYTMVSGYFKEKRLKYLLDGVILLCFINPYMVETYVYGSFDWAVGIWLAVFAVKKLAHKRYILGMFISLCATSVYQSNIFIVLILWLLMIFLEYHEKDIKKLVRYMALAIFATVAVAMCSILLQKLLKLAINTSAMGKDAVLPENIGERIKFVLVSALNTLWSMHGMLPRRSLFIFVAAIYCMAMYVLLAKKKAVLAAVVWTVMLGILFLVPFSYGLVASTAFHPRTILGLFFSVSAFLISALYIVKDNIKITKAIKGCCFLFAIVVVFYTETCIMDCYIRQALDFNEAMCIQAEIEEYEEATGIEVKSVSAGRSPKPIYYSSMLHLSYDVTYNYRIMHDDWAQAKFLNYVAHENYEVNSLKEEDYEKYFGTKSWEVFNPSEQLYFEGDTLYWAIY